MKLPELGFGRAWRAFRDRITRLFAQPPATAPALLERDTLLSDERSMGIFREYLDKKLKPDELEKERKKYLKKLGEALDADVIVYSARLTAIPPGVQLPVGILYEDLLPFSDLLGGLKKKRVAVILETPGGSGETARDMVEMLHQRFEEVIFVVPGTAKSAGTIMVLGGHEIMMGPESSLGPIDAQIVQSG